MESIPPPTTTPSAGQRILQIAVNVLVVLSLIYLLITAVGMVGSGFKLASGGQSAAEGFLAQATNPIIGLILGIFATALVQSSSTVTSVIVGLVATGQVPVSMAVPMIMGANIGTTVTNTIVSLAHITRPQEFRQAFAAATVHDLFNFIAVTIFLPLEIITRYSFGVGLIEGMTSPVAEFLLGPDGTQAAAGAAKKAINIKDFNVIKSASKTIIHLFYDPGDPDTGLLSGLGRFYGGISLCVVAIAMIFGCIWAMGRFLKAKLVGRAERIFHAAVGRGPLTGIASGTAITIMVQSSSTTTSLVVPMAGAGIMRLEQVFPFTLGANIGTTVTALLASMAASKHPEAGLHIALVHLVFNLMATVVIYGIPWLRRLPLIGARWLAELGCRNKTAAMGYILGVYFGIPLIIIGLSQAFGGDAAEAPTDSTPIETPTTPGVD